MMSLPASGQVLVADPRMAWDILEAIPEATFDSVVRVPVGARRGLAGETIRGRAGLVSGQSG